MNNIEELKTKLEKARSNARKLDNQIAAIQDEIKKLEEREESPKLERQKEGDDFYVIRTDDTAQMVVKPCMEVDSVYCNDCYRNNNYFLTRNRGNDVLDNVNRLMCAERICDEYPNYGLEVEVRLYVPNYENAQKFRDIFNEKLNQLK